MAEVYWDLEWTLQQQGFDYTYDKRLYDRLRDRHAGQCASISRRRLDYQDRLARFLENHDEPRAAATFPTGPARSRGRHHVSLSRACVSSIRDNSRDARNGFHRISFAARTSPSTSGCSSSTNACWLCCGRPVVRDGQWQLLECHPAWDGNGSADAFIAYAWQGRDGDRLMVAVNYSDHQSQCYVGLPFPDLAGRRWRLRDRLGDASYDRDGTDLRSRGLYLDVKPWQYHVFEIANA